MQLENRSLRKSMTKMTWAKRIIPILYCLIFIFSEALVVLTLPRSVWPYFQIPSIQNSLFEELEKKEPADPNGPIVMYFTLQKGNSDLNFFSKGVSLLTPIDTLKTDFLLYQIFHRPQPINDDPLADLIYANIELKRYMDKYKELEKYAKNILAYSNSILHKFSGTFKPISTEIISTSFHKGRTNLPKQIKQKSKEELREKNTLDNHKQKQNILTRIQKKLTLTKHKIINTISKGATTEVFKKGEDSAEISLALERSSQSIQFKGRSKNSSSEVSPKTSSYTTLKSLYYRGSISPKVLQSNNLEHSNSNQHTGKSESPAQIDISETPWIIKAPIEFLAWAMKNKLEALLLILFVLMISKFIGTLFRRS